MKPTPAPDPNRFFDEILLAEGGFVDHPSDPGGATNYGISLRFLQDLHRRRSTTYRFLFGTGEPTVDLVRNLTIAQAKALFHEEFYVPLRVEALSYDLALAVCDYAFNAGRHQAIKDLQRAHNELVEEGGLTYRGEILKLDGVIGPVTIRNLRLVLDTKGDDLLLYLYAKNRKRFYQTIISRKPQLSAFKRGWDRRVEKMHRDTHDLPPHLEGNITHE